MYILQIQFHVIQCNVKFKSFSRKLIYTLTYALLSSFLTCYLYESSYIAVIDPYTFFADVFWKDAYSFASFSLTTLIDQISGNLTRPRFY